LAIAHRGPDDEQFYDDGTLSLVFRRLSIVDLAGGRQPIFSADGEQLVVVNGEIYNHQELRQSLSSRAKFATQSDSEVPLHLLAQYGADGLQQMRGMFALAHWDRRERRLLLARDRLGIKPLYIARLSTGWLFGSELKALLQHPECPRKLNWSVLDVTPAQMRSPATTYVEGIEHLPGGAFLSATATGVSTQPYWHIDAHLGTARFGQDGAAYSREFQRLIEESTAEHMLGDVAIGLHLSGGLDSSLLAGIAARQGHKLACYSLVERGSYRAGDVNAAKALTQSLKLPWYPVLFDYRNLLDELAFDLSAFEQSVAMMDSPRFDMEWIFKLALHRVVSRENPDMKVILLGQGADEFAGGYSRRIDRPCASWTEYLTQEVEPNVNFYDALESKTPLDLCLLRRNTPAVTAIANLGPYHQLMRRLTLQLQHFNLWHEDRSSMSASLEARVPFLDHRLVELLASVPTELHEKLFWNKKIIRDVAQTYLPNFDHSRLKLPFVNNGDSRSIDIMVHSMAVNIAPAFFEKYAEREDFPFDAKMLRLQATSIIERRGNFYQDALHLMERMAIAVFSHQLQNPEVFTIKSTDSVVTGPAIITAAQWPSIYALFSAEPVVPENAWHLHDQIVLPQGAEILQPLSANAPQRYFLVSAGNVNAEITLAQSDGWLRHFLRNLGKGAATDFTIADWLDEFDIELPQFCAKMDFLYQAGFVQKRTM
jgi:asparagine synthase (glutamine-hydrolysing)